MVNKHNILFIVALAAASTVAYPVNSDQRTSQPCHGLKRIPALGKLQFDPARLARKKDTPAGLSALYGYDEVERRDVLDSCGDDEDVVSRRFVLIDGWDEQGRPTPSDSVAGNEITLDDFVDFEQLEERELSEADVSLTARSNQPAGNPLVGAVKNVLSTVKNAFTGAPNPSPPPPPPPPVPTATPSPWKNGRKPLQLTIKNVETFDFWDWKRSTQQPPSSSKQPSPMPVLSVGQLLGSVRQTGGMVKLLNAIPAQGSGIVSINTYHGDDLERRSGRESRSPRKSSMGRLLRNNDNSIEVGLNS